MSLKKEFVKEDWRNLETVIFKVFLYFMKWDRELTDEQLKILKTIKKFNTKIDDQIFSQILTTIIGREKALYKRAYTQKRRLDKFMLEISALIERMFSSYDASSLKVHFVAIIFALLKITENKKIYYDEQVDETLINELISLFRISAEQVKFAKPISKIINELGKK